MKVLHVLNEISHSGAELMLYSSYPYFKKEDIEFVALATGRKKGSFSGKFEEAGVRTVLNPLLKGITLPFKFFPYFLSYMSYLKKEEVHVVHIHRMYLYFWYALFARLAGIKIVIRTVHNVFKPTYRYPQYYLSRKILRLLGVEFTSIGKSVENHELKFFKNRTVRINNWFDPKYFFPLTEKESKEAYRKANNIPLDARVVISVGSCLPQKNHHHIIKAIERLQLRYTKLFYLHVGDGPLCAEEQELIKSSGLSKNSLYVGNVNNVREFLVLSDIYVMPSDFEGLSISLLEAMACGITPVGYDVSGIKDLIVPGLNGLLIPKSIDELSNSIEYLILNEEQRLEFSKKSIELVENEYNIEKSVSQFIALYQTTK